MLAVFGIIILLLSTIEALFARFEIKFCATLAYLSSLLVRLTQELLQKI